MSSINLLVALPAEAKPITSRLELERVQPDLEFRLYRRGDVTLVITGPGKVNAAAGTAFLGTLEDRRRNALWVNLGIAGHAERGIGDVLLASSIRDLGSGEVWHPILPEDAPCPAERLVTLDRPDPDYDHEGMVDMEASGFFPTACRYCGIERVQVLKVISDNRSNPARGLGAKQVRRLIGEMIGTLETLLARLQLPGEAPGKSLGGRRAD